jgi:cysteine synthase A
MEKVAKNMLELIGNTPLVEIGKLNPGPGRVLGKLEMFNPFSSVKDRIGAAMIEDAEKRGMLKPGGVMIEPTSGNTGIGLAAAAALKGYRLILTMPETMSIERRKLLLALGAEIVLTPGESGMAGAVARAVELCAALPGAIMPGQFDNPANPECHRRTTAAEIWRDTGGRVDVLVCGVGTGGTLTGTGSRLRELNPALRIVAVEPAESAVISGGAPGPHRIQGIGAGFVPKNLDTGLIDEIATVRSDDAGAMARRAAKTEGLLIGISGGAALLAAIRQAEKPEHAGKTIVVILPDCGERYLSTWLYEEAR